MASTWTISSPFLLCHSSFGRRDIVVCDNQLSSQRPKLKAVTMSTPTTIRRSANYQPSLWSYDYLQSLDSKYTGQKYMQRLRTLKEEIRSMIVKEHEKVENPLSVLNLVDDLQRLGISYHFVNEIRDVLEKIYYDYYISYDKWCTLDLNQRSLGFRLFRQHGYHIPQEIFEDLKDESTGNFKSSLYEDIVGMLNLYEASYHSVEDESILDDARDFTTKHLNECLENIVDNNYMSSLITHALAFPLHWRVPRVETKWFIEAYEKRSGMNMNPALIEFAKLDFNMLQAIHQEDLKYVSRWWKETCWDKFAFARDHLVESFMWSIGENYMPHFHGRTTLTKVFAMITTIDDIYDVYGTLHELEQFTDIVTRWDVNVMEELPDYMRICFLVLYKSINEIAYSSANNGFFILQYLKKEWGDLCKSYLVEAKWYNNGYTPTLNEFINNAYVSIGAGVVIMHAYLLTIPSVTEEDLQHISKAGNIIRHASVIVRLTNDLATSADEMEIGDVPKSVQCYMQESGASEVEAREHIKLLVLETWKKMNKEGQRISSSFPHEFIECIINLARMGHFAYDVNRHAYQDMMRTHVLSLCVNPIQGL